MTYVGFTERPSIALARDLGALACEDTTQAPGTSAHRAYIFHDLYRTAFTPTNNSVGMLVASIANSL